MLAATEPPPPDALVDFASLPFNAIAAVVAHLSSLPSHQAGAALGALRLLSKHWRAAVDDAVTAWSAPPAATAEAIACLLHRWRHLRSLTLQHCELSGAVVEALAHCRRLQELTLCMVVLQPSASGLCDVLASLPALRLLHFNPRQALPPGANLKALAACRALQSLTLDSLYQQVRWAGGGRLCPVGQRLATLTALQLASPLPQAGRGGGCGGDCGGHERPPGAPGPRPLAASAG